MTSVRVLGCSDAFSSGTRLFPAFYVDTGAFRFLLDCGPTAVLAMKREGIDPDSLDAVLISHFHGDHYAGLPFLEIELGIMHERRRPLIVGGPPGVEQRVKQISEDAYPSGDGEERISYEFVEWREAEEVEVGELRVTGIRVEHAPESQPFGLRIEAGGTTLAYSGDSEWTDALVRIAAGADLFICEALTFERDVKNHVSYRTLMEHRNQFTCRRMLLTHMSEDMLRRLPVEHADAAYDGMLLQL